MLRIDKNILLRWSLMAIMTVSVVFPRVGFCIAFEHEHPVAAEELLTHTHLHQHSFGHGSHTDCRTFHGWCSEGEDSQRHQHHCFVCCADQTDATTTKAAYGVSFKRFSSPISFDISDFQMVAIDPTLSTDRDRFLPSVPLPDRDLNLLYRSLRI